MTVASLVLALILSGPGPRAPQPPVASTIESIEIVWPGGAKQNLAIDKVRLGALTVIEQPQ